MSNKVGHNPKTPLSFEEAVNMVADKKKNMKKTVKEHSKDMKPTVTPKEDVLSFLGHCIQWLNPADKKFLATFIADTQSMTKDQAYNNMCIRIFGKVNPDNIIAVKKIERAIFEKTRDHIAQKVKTEIPIVGGKPHIIGGRH